MINKISDAVRSLIMIMGGNQCFFSITTPVNNKWSHYPTLKIDKSKLEISRLSVKGNDFISLSDLVMQVL